MGYKFRITGISKQTGKVKVYRNSLIEAQRHARAARAYGGTKIRITRVRV